MESVRFAHLDRAAELLQLIIHTAHLLLLLVNSSYWLCVIFVCGVCGVENDYVCLVLGFGAYWLTFSLGCAVGTGC